MEILNNIWVAVSTENKILVDILLVPFGIVESLLMMMLILFISNAIPTKKQKIIYAILIFFVMKFTNYIIANPFNVFINYFVMFIAACLILKITFLNSLISTIFSAIIINLVTTLILNPFITLFGISTNELSVIPIYRILYVTTVYIPILIVIMILKHRGYRITFVESLDKNTKRMIFITMLLGLLTVVIQSITLFYYVDTLPILITFLNFISFFVYFTINIYALTRAFKLVSTAKKLQSAEEYNKTLHVLHDGVRCFKHDFDNTVTTIGGYIATEDMKGLKDYYSQLVDDCQSVNNLYLLDPDSVKNDGIYNLLVQKYNEADSENIKINISFLLDLSTLNMKIYDFAKILGILLDNAIESSAKCEKKIINLIFRNDYTNSRQLIIIENTYKNKNLDIEKIFEKGHSEKENHTGLGLWEVRKIIKKNNNINLHTSKTDELFSQQLEIYYKQEK